MVHFMQKEPMVSIRIAADLLQLDKKSIRERLINGQLSGEKKTIGSREKWFVHSAAVETLLEERRTQIPANTTPQLITATAVDDYVDDDLEDGIEHERRRQPSSIARGEWYQKDRERIDSIIEQIIKPMLDKCANQADLIADQEKVIEEQKVQLRLLPDLQAESLRAYELEEEIISLQKVRAEISEDFKNEIEDLRQAKDLQEKAAAEKVAALTKEIEQLNTRPWWQKLFTT